jgi:Flp pilus assembly protein TadB
LYLSQEFLQHRRRIVLLPGDVERQADIHIHEVRRLRALDAWLLITSCGVAMLAVVAAWLGVSVAACLVILVLAPATTVVVYEVWGYRHQAAALGDQ